MAQLQGTFTSKETAMQAVQKLRAMDIPDEDIMVNQEGKGDKAKFMLTAEVPDGQFSAAQAVVNAAVGGAGNIQPLGATATGGSTSATVTGDDQQTVYSGGRLETANDLRGSRTGEGSTVAPDVAAMAGPGVIGSGALGGPAALTARATAVGTADELADETLERTDPDNQGDTINSVSPR